jgi:divalent metal cation (Fe/Co/Zn/Cd) transporter
MNILFFILLHICAAFAIYYLAFNVIAKHYNKLKNQKKLQWFFIIVITLALIGNYYLANYLLNY